MNTCPVTGKVCNKAPVFVITEQLGDKAQSTSCCRDCASHHILQRNNLVAAKEPEHNGVQMVPVNDFVAKVFGYAGAGKSETAPKPTKKTCGYCGSNFDQILAQNRLGCVRCWDTFQEELKPYLSRAQAGQQKHTGKVPLSAKLASLPPEEQVAVLESSMQVAIDQEDYEKAAKFRDMIKKIKESSPPKD